MQKKLLFFGLCSVLLAADVVYVSWHHKAPVEPLTFSGTQQWDATLLKKSHEKTVFTDAELATIRLDPPPANDSDITKSELATLHAYVARRTPEKVAEITREIDFKTAVFGTTTIGESITKFHPNTSKLLMLANELVTPVVLREKFNYNRVRPSHLDPTLSVVLPIPGHPAYPSGHSTQSFLSASILSKLNPSMTESYYVSALRIAHDREIAGLHYPSDTAAGKKLASQLLPLLFENSTFVDLYNRAQKEW